MDKSSKYLKCDDCGLESPEVFETICPFTLEIYDREEEAHLCPQCYQDRCDDI